MDEARYRQEQAVRRVFGPAAALFGSLGSRRGPGHIEIRLDGRTLGSGASFEQALQDTSRRQREAVR